MAFKKAISVEEIGVKIGSGDVQTYDCIGTLTLTSASISKTKKCGAAEEVVAVVVTGAGNATLETHMDSDDLASIFGLAASKKGFGAKKGNRRPDVEITAKGTDEDENVLLVAIPLAKVTSDEVTVIDVDNAGTEIPYTSLELAYRPDSNGYGFYGLEEDDLPSTVTEDSFMTAFDTNKAAILAVME